MSQPIEELERWSSCLRRVSSSGLQLCPQFPAIARRHEAWWAHALLDRPLFLGTANKDPSRAITRRLELLHDPDVWLAAKQADLRQTLYIGDALPNIRVDFGPVMLGGLLGGSVWFESDTTWTEAFINDDWSNAPSWSIAQDSAWWNLLQLLLARVAEDAAGRYLLCTPDLGGSADLMLNFRGSSQLCMDVVDQPERVRAAIDAVYPAWRQTFCELYRITTAAGAGLIHWLGLWSDVPYMIPACDFSFMISPQAFQRVCLPDIARQAATVGRAVFHLDGAGAARHIDALLEVPEIQAIQFTPGTGSPSALPWIPMVRKIQGKGRSVLIVAPAEEVGPLCDALDPRGLAFLVYDSPRQAIIGAFDEICRRFGSPGDA